MTDFQTIEMHVDADQIAWLTLARPQQHNAFNRQMIDELTAAAALLSTNETVRAVVLRAEGKSFCAVVTCAGCRHRLPLIAMARWPRHARWRICCWR